MLNLIVWRRRVFDIETVLTLNWIVWNILTANGSVNKKKTYLYLTELFELELFDLRE